ncbi:MAG: DUF3299 domain-containing protein [Hydrogenophaga sp.]|nr:DUF3299 domain-containing protein [Hydrogenophaga sp.]
MWAAAVTTVSAQGLSSPMGEQPSGQKAPAPVPHLQGQGPGVHSPLSSFAPIKPREDVVHWSVLTDIKTELRNRRIVPVYTPAIQALNGKTQRVQGFMLPLGAGEQQRHFLLVSIPPSCPFCTPGGPESMVEIRTRAPVKYSLDIVVVEGRFHVLQNDPYGLYYRMTEAVGVK